MATSESKFQENPTPTTQKLLLGTQICVRLFLLATTLASTWLILTAKQSTEMFGIVFIAQYSYSPAFKFLGFANAVACAYALFSLCLLLILNCHLSNPTNFFFLFLQDLFMMLVVVGGCAAATAIGYVGKNGNLRAGWSPICDQFERFCHRMMISMILSYMSLIFLLTLTIISASKSRQTPV